jgi:hypothetical protein
MPSTAWLAWAAINSYRSFSATTVRLPPLLVLPGTQSWWETSGPFPAPGSFFTKSTILVWLWCWRHRPAAELADLREVLDADDAIDGQTTADEVANSKPDPEVFVTAMENASIDPRRALAIGDSVWDIRSARAAGIACVTVETGGFSQHELNEAGSARVYRDVNELLSQLFTSPIASLLKT